MPDILQGEPQKIPAGNHSRTTQPDLFLLRIHQVCGVADKKNMCVDKQRGPTALELLHEFFFFDRDIMMRSELAMDGGGNQANKRDRYHADLQPA